MGTLCTRCKEITSGSHLGPRVGNKKTSIQNILISQHHFGRR